MIRLVTTHILILLLTLSCLLWLIECWYNGQGGTCHLYYVFQGHWTNCFHQLCECGVRLLRYIVQNFHLRFSVFNFSISLHSVFSKSSLNSDLPCSSSGPHIWSRALTTKLFSHTFPLRGWTWHRNKSKAMGMDAAARLRVSYLAIIYTIIALFCLPFFRLQH